MCADPFVPRAHILTPRPLVDDGQAIPRVRTAQRQFWQKIWQKGDNFLAKELAIMHKMHQQFDLQRLFDRLWRLLRKLFRQPY